MAAALVKLANVRHVGLAFAVSNFFLILKWTLHHFIQRHLLWRNALWLVVGMETAKSRFAVALLAGLEWIVPQKHSAQTTAIPPAGAA